MGKRSCLFSRLTALALAMLVLLSFPGAALAADPEDGDTASETGTYLLDGSLKCYVNAMGGIDFGKGMLTGISVEIDEDGNAAATLKLAASSVTIYSVTANTFIDARASAPGYYSGGSVVSAKYTLSSGTALDPNGNAVRYVDSITFPVQRNTGTYYLYLYVNSSVMGVQFCDGSGSGASNVPGVETPYQAVLTIDWGSLSRGETSNRSARVVYTVEGGYVVSIPASIHVNPEKIGIYEILLEEFHAPANSFIRVSAAEYGELRNAGHTLSFRNTLEEKDLTAAGDSLAGTITVLDEPENIGLYSGIVDFVIRYYESAEEADAG